MKYPEDFKNQIICGNSLEIIKEIPDKSIDLIITDPPYGLGFKYDSYEDTQDNLKKLVDNFMPEATRVAKLVVLTPGINNIHLYPKPTWILAWTYHGSNLCSWGFNCWQPILVYGADPYLRDRLGARGDVIVNNNTTPRIWDHPCPKPDSFIAKLIVRVSTRKEDIILDPFVGVGTVCKVAQDLGRSFIGIDISQKYCAIAKERLRQRPML